MIFDQMEFHNVEAMAQQENGSLKMSRLPRKVAEQLDYGIRDTMSFRTTGVEIRFRMISEEVKIHLCAEQDEEAQTALIYFGSIQGGWQYAAKQIGTQDTVISIKYPEKLEELEKISEDAEFPFSPRMVRVILPYGFCWYLGKEGETQPPYESDKPKLRYLAYGSSITHGSMALAAPGTYPFLIADRFGADCFNQGYAGSAFAERPMAEYMAARKDWDFASAELGINMLNKPVSDWEYEQRVVEFLKVLAEDGRPVFVTDIFVHNGDKQERTDVFRDIVKRHARGGNLIYTSGRELMGNPAYITADMTHPSIKGQQEISRNWSEIIESKLRLSVRNMFSRR